MRKIVIVVLLSTTILASISIGFLKPTWAKDSEVVLSAISVLDGNPAPVNYWPLRLMTSSLYSESILIMSKIFGSIKVGWLVLNSIFYCLVGLVFYLILEIIFKNQRTAFIGTLFLIMNYGIVVFGLHLLVDIGGWLFYLLSLYFLLRYVDSRENKWLLLSGVAVGFGGLMKEFGFLGFLAVFVFVVHENYPSLSKIVKKTFWPVIFSFSPVTLVFIYIYFKFHYSYLDWFGQNMFKVSYFSRTVEYVKSLGSLFNLLSFFVLAGLYYFWKQRESLVENKYYPFIIAVCISALPVFFWPAITQRILFILAPAATIIACFFIKKLDKYWYVFGPILLVYFLFSLYMDSFILNYVNLPF